MLIYFSLIRGGGVTDNAIPLTTLDLLVSIFSFAGSSYTVYVLFVINMIHVRMLIIYTSTCETLHVTFKESQQLRM